MITIQDVAKVHKTGAVEVHALLGVSLHVDSGEVVAIMGPSGSGEEILRTFESLNRERGITVVIVTHDPGIGARAARTIHLKDGQLATGQAPGAVAESVRIRKR